MRRRILRKLMKSPWVGRGGGYCLAWSVRALMGTLDYQTIYLTPGTDPAVWDLAQQRFIYVFWHEYILFPFYLRGHNDVCMLLSQNKDAEFLAHAARYMGFHCVRGSTFTGARTAVRGLLNAGDTYHLTMTPDGPRGPRRQLSQGPVYLASKLQLPIIALGFGYDRPRRLNSWDRFAIPRPFSRARAVFSAPIHVPAKLAAAQWEPQRRAIESVLDEVTKQAEEWAESGVRRAGAQKSLRQPRKSATSEGDENQRAMSHQVPNLRTDGPRPGTATLQAAATGVYCRGKGSSRNGTTVATTDRD